MYLMIKSLIVITLNLLAIKQSESYPTGAPEQVCDKLIPAHGDNRPQTSDSPYQISGQPLSNGSFELLIDSPQNHESFRGFAILARLVNSSDPIGKFLSITADSKTINCGHQNNTLTHSNRNEKQKMTAIWIPPKDWNSEEEVEFYGTVVKDKKTFWVAQYSKPFSPVKDNSVGEHNKDPHSDHKSGSNSKVTNSSPNNGLNYLLISSVVLILFRKN